MHSFEIWVFYLVTRRPIVYKYSLQLMFSFSGYKVDLYIARAGLIGRDIVTIVSLVYAHLHPITYHS